MDALEERVAAVKAATGFEDDERRILAYEGWVYGDRARVINDDENQGIFSGDEGYVIISEVGGAEYGNVRTCISILTDGTDCPMEVDPENIENV